MLVPSDPSLDIGGEAVPLRVCRNPRARQVTLRADAVRREVRIALPPRVALREALRFAEAQRGWIAARLARAPAPVPLVPGATIAVEGAAVTIAWDAGYPRRPARVEGELRLGGAPASVGRRALAWLKEQARERMTADAQHYAARAGVAPPRLMLSDPRMRWGSCSSAGVVRLSWRLVMAPPAVRRSVVAHEVAHLVHLNHGRAFWALLDRIYEGERSAADAWLKTHGLGLHMIGRD